MTREERAYNYAANKKATKFTVGEIAKHYNDGYSDGCKDTINKTCEWLKRHVEGEKYKTPDEESYRHGLPCDYFETDMFIDDFRKAMEENK